MTKKPLSLQLTIALSFLFIAAHFAAAVILCRERLFLDASYFFFHAVNEECFRIEHQRIILAVSQVLLLAGVKMHLNINLLFILYSITPVIFSALFIFISLFYFSSEAAALLIILCNVCGTRFLYYCPMYEICYAVVTFSFLWLLTKQIFYRSPLQITIYLLTLMVCLLGYPLLAFGCVVLFLYQIILNKKGSRALMLINLFAFGVWLAVKYLYLSDYEKGKINIPLSDYPGILLKISSFTFIKAAAKFLFINYTEPMMGWFIFLLLMLKQKRYLLFFTALSSVVFFIGIVNLGYRGNALIHSNNFERMYLLLIPLCFGPLFFIAYDRFSQNIKIVCILLVAGVACYRSFGTWNRHKYYSDRIQLMNNMAGECLQRGCDKGTVDWNRLPPALNEWSTGMEVLIYSSSRGKSCIISDSTMVAQLKNQGALNEDWFLLRLNEVMQINELNPYYFKLYKSPYCVLPGY